MFGHTRALKAQICSLEKRLQDAESDIKAYKEVIQDHTNELEGLRNIANSRLSALVGMRRYLDSFFDDGSTTAPVSQKEKVTAKPARQTTPDFKNPKQPPPLSNLEN